MLHVPPHVFSVLQALLVTFLWSSSWVLIKFGLKDIPPLTFAGLRYTLAFFCLLPFAWKPLKSAIFKRNLSPALWRGVALLGLVLYTVTQGAQFLALAYLPAITASLILSFTPVLVAWLGMRMLKEIPAFEQWVGLFLFLVGALLYFLPLGIAWQQTFGLLVAFVGLLANAGSSILGRRLNRAGQLSPLALTTASMGVGGIALLIVGTLTQGFPAIGLRGWGIIAWLAVVNTAFAFTLWNHTLKSLSALESSLINNTMLLQIAVLAWLFLGESLSPKETVGLVLVGAGVLLAQLRRT